MEWEISAEQGLQQVAEWVISRMPEVHIFLLDGDLGAGKTTLVKYICKSLQATDVVQSPTFSIIHEYHFTVGPEGKPGKLFHMDLYRIRNLEEAFQIGIEEYLAGEQVCLIEWPDVIYPIIHDPFLRIRIEVGPQGQRKIRILKHLRDTEKPQEENGRHN